MTDPEMRHEHVILFDGVCNLCNASVGFVLQHERKPLFQFASIQSKTGQALLEQFGLPPDYMQSVILIDQGRPYFGSTAALKIGQTLKFPWSLLAAAGFLFSKPIREWG